MICDVILNEDGCASQHALLYTRLASHVAQKGLVGYVALGLSVLSTFFQACAVKKKKES